MFRSLTIVALCMFSLSAFAQTAPPAATGQDPQPPSAATGERKAGRVKQGKRVKFMQKMDANADGKVAREEWKGKPEGFDKLDTDKDGFLTQTEVRDVVRDKGADMFKQFDANSDGKIAREEWSQRSRAFDRMDTNADGFLTPDELRNLKGRRFKKQQG